MHLTDAQLKRLQEEKPNISTDDALAAASPGDIAAGTFWLATVNTAGRLEVCSANKVPLIVLTQL